MSLIEKMNNGIRGSLPASANQARGSIGRRNRRIGQLNVCSA